MTGAVKGGYQENDYTLLIGKALHFGEWTIEKPLSPAPPLLVFLLSVSSVLIVKNVALNADVEAVVQDFFWRDYVHGDIPCDAIEASSGRYIGQAYHNGNMVATIYPHSDAAIIEMGGKKGITDNVKIFCSNQPQNLFWEKVNFDKPYDGQMKDAVKGGYQANEFTLFIGKALHQGEWKIGKIFCSNRRGNFYWEKVNFSQPNDGQMANVVRGGYQLDDGSQFNLFIGKAFHENEWKVGKVVEITHRWKGIWLWDRNGKSINLQEFYILKYNVPLNGCNKQKL
ncbi:hypothetical protein Trydic_g1639 [Trypoxylus dichotomus]